MRSMSVALKDHVPLFCKLAVCGLSGSESAHGKMGSEFPHRALQGATSLTTELPLSQGCVDVSVPLPL